jgi:hypothetical protein
VISQSGADPQEEWSNATRIAGLFKGVMMTSKDQEYIPRQCVFLPAPRILSAFGLEDEGRLE